MENIGSHNNTALRDTLENRALGMGPWKDKPFHPQKESQLQSGWFVEGAGGTGVHRSSAWFLSWVRNLRENLKTSLCKPDFPSIGIPRQFPGCPHTRGGIAQLRCPGMNAPSHCCWQEGTARRQILASFSLGLPQKPLLTLLSPE